MNVKGYENNFSFDQLNWLNAPASANGNQVVAIQFETGKARLVNYVEVGALDKDSAFSVIYSVKDTSESFTIQ